ncbi:MAG: TraR/DksA C4-type zinc finger protein [Actinomycetota bacterium]|nr:TraR/DksA C4-type zinc finger protein [Actinomycetota bacterium]
MSQAEADLEELDQALDRLRDGTYGACVRCGAPIPDERLAAQPTTLTCVGCAHAGAAANSRRLRRA